MIGTLILSHGNLADELLAAARTISGDLDGFAALSLDWSDGFDEAQTRIAQALESLDQGDGVVILTDMFGGTPCNVALTFMDPGKVEIVTGVNLPMVVRLACRGKREKPVHEVARWLREKGRAAICLASDVQAERCCAPGGALRGRGGGRRRGGAGGCGPRGRRVIEREVEIVNRLGLHARAAAKLVHLAGSFDCDVTLVAGRRGDGRQEHPRHPAAGGGQGTRIVVRCDGSDEEEAMDALAALIADRFGEGS